MSVRKSSHGTIFLIVSSGSPRALIASSLRSTSKKPFCPMTRSLHPPMTACGHRVRFAATWREEFFEVPTMQFVRPAVSTLCVGQAASMASLLLAAGQKDMRFALPNSRIMLHQPSGGFQGQATDIMLHAQEILNLKKRLNEIYVKHTGQPLKKIEDALERDYFLTGEMAMEWGIVDKVINKRPEDPAAIKVV